ncbi:MAG: shikimate kinase [Muribaculum sp.]|nr:shikimate kinase [Muribaculum sp.]
MEPIFIIGYMASGKTTLGKALARRMGLQHIDLDFYIEQRFHCSIRDLFAKKGENEFRRIETNMLHEVGEFSDVIISCGGGTPCFCDNMDYMNSRGLTVCLKTDNEVIADRIVLAGDKRPLMAGKKREDIMSTIIEHLAVRAPFYDKSQIFISGNRLESKSQIADTVEDFIRSYFPESKN